MLGMVVSREWEIRKFVKTPFYRVIGLFGREQTEEEEAAFFESEWRVNEKSKYFQSPKLYKENGFTEESFAKELIDTLMAGEKQAIVEKVEKKKEKKNPHCFSIWRNYRTCRRNCLRSVRTRHCRSFRNYMKKAGYLSENGCPCAEQCCRKKRLQRISKDFRGMRWHFRI